MPLYEYKCESCGDVFEVMQKFSDEPLQEHPGCGGAVHRLLSAPALQFKGSGWYVTDYAKGNSSAERPKSDSSDSTKTDSAKNGATKPGTAPAAAPTSSPKSTKTE
jgi:putative FmdB family regulatory protein